MANPILVTGAAGRVGAVGRTVTELLLKQGKAVRAMVRNEDERAQALRDMGAEVVIGDLLDLDSMHRVIAGCETMYFGMSVSDTYLAATVNVAAVAKHHRVKAFINMSQMTLAQMSITETTPSPQHKLHWLAEQALNWSGLPVVHVRPTVFLEGFFLIFTADSVRDSNQIRVPFGEGKTSPIAAEDVARVIAALLANPKPHIGKIYHLTGPQSENMHFYAQEYSKALPRLTNGWKSKGGVMSMTISAKAQPVDMKLEVVLLSVSDVDRAKAFYENLGWRLDLDIAGGDFRG